MSEFNTPKIEAHRHKNDRAVDEGVINVDATTRPLQNVKTGLDPVAKFFLYSSNKFLFLSRQNYDTQALSKD